MTVRHTLHAKGKNDVFTLYLRCNTNSLTFEVINTICSEAQKPFGQVGCLHVGSIAHPCYHKVWNKFYFYKIASVTQGYEYIGTKLYIYIYIYSIKIWHKLILTYKKWTTPRKVSKGSKRCFVGIEELFNLDSYI